MSEVKLKKNACAFVTSSFGFGPVSKAATIAREVKNRFPQTKTHFFGNGIAMHFAKQSGVFDLLIEIEAEDTRKLKSIISKLKNYEIVFSVLNLTILPLWKKSFGKLFFVDSLAWMWNQPPAGIENTTTYFIQDYLVSPERIEKWKQLCQITTVPPIGLLPETKSPKAETKRRGNRLLVNFSGCFNQFIDRRVYEKYVTTLLPLIVEASAVNFDEIEISVNLPLAERLKKRFHHAFLKIGQLPHQDFLAKLADSRFLLTVPGITTTLEAIASDTPLGFLLPQNDSQALMSEIYRRQIDESLTMAFSRFEEKLAFPLSLDDFESLEQPVELAVARMGHILETHQNKIKQFIAEMLKKSSNNSVENLKSNIHQTWNKTGQAVIIEEIFELSPSEVISGL